MLVKINAEKLKQLRDQRCWSQQQLADVSGLSLRTVQRIEARAVASQESVKCLAAVFETDTQALLAVSPEPHVEVDNHDTVCRLSSGNCEEDDSVTQRADKVARRKAFKKLYVSFALVFVSHLAAFFCIFAAFNQNEITEHTFQLLKNTVSVALVVSAIVLLWRDRQLKKKYYGGSSLF
ncbi:helix-turn-helix domain-containing protein [Alteromonas halophila]|uniref:HTH cro/C1-type domain-containing protein n=1 Tax=Alteromonas halophila TaxID=516698 RepID=A0A918N100_9ALTE|nr:helix-turn-helix transcriptional regulator [Alteromonas halophila]GGW95737.1 hypothetical protein GCM10007391_32370 [Alteromonas halophila]